MAWYLRLGFTGHRWINLPWLAAGEVQADAVRDFSSIRDNTMSVYLVNSEQDGFRAAIAIASKREQTIDFGYALVEAGAVMGIGLEPMPSDGETPDPEVNAWHYELRELTFSRVAEIAKLIKQRGRVEDIPLPTFKEHLRRAVQARQLDVSQVHRKNLA